MRLRSFRAVLTDVEREIPYRVSLMEALEPVKADGDYVVAVIEESEMSDDQFLAGLSFALQVPGSGKQRGSSSSFARYVLTILLSTLLFHLRHLHYYQLYLIVRVIERYSSRSFLPIMPGFRR